MDKKGMTGMVMLVVGALLAVILIANVLAPVVDQSRSSQATSESLSRTLATGAETETLSKATSYTLETATLTIAGLTTPANYTVDYSTGVVTWNVTANGTYTASYNYYEASYLDNSRDRTLIGLVILASLLGLVYVIFRGFGMA